MSAQIINLEMYRRSRYFKAMKQRMARGEIRLPTSIELRQEWALVASALSIPLAPTSAEE